MKREQRRIWRGYLAGISEYLKPKPKWYPWWLWTWMQKQVIRTDKIDPMI
jgi:hypothetical protein